MVKVISKAISLANAPMLTSTELLIRARDWADVLCDCVPVHALEPAIRKAFETHDSSFPLNAYELKTAYFEIRDRIQTVANSRTLTTDERVARCTNKDNHLPDRFGEIEIFMQGVTEDDVIVPCGICRKEDFMEAKAELLRGKA